MPNWKKVITSGSDASLNSLDVALDITGSNALITNDLDVLGNVGIGTTSPFYPLHINKNTVGNGFSINIFSTATKPDAQGGSVYGGFFFGKGNSTATVDNIVGSRNYGEHTGTGQATFIAGSSHFAVHNGSGNSTGIYAISPKAEIKGTGVGSHQYVIGANINNVLNNSNATVQYLEGAHIAVNLQNGTVTDNAIGLVLDFDYTAGVVSGDLDYLRIQNDTLPTVGGTARAINSLSTLPSTFAGDIGIGTTSPGAKLDVDGDVKFSSYGSGTNTGTATQRLGVTSAGNVIEIPIGSGAVDGSGTTNFVTKWIDGDTVGDSVIFDNGTNVGIGTTSPNKKLHVNSGAINEAARFESTDVGAFIEFKDSSTTDLPIIGGVGNNFDIRTGGSTSVRVTSAGNVGIGTDSPGTKLHLADSASGGNPSFILQDDARSGAAALNYILLTDSLNTNQAKIGYLSGLNTDLTLQNLVGSTSLVSSAQTKVIAGTNTLFENSGSEKMRITSAGSVGIGTTSPSSKLQVSADNGDGITLQHGASNAFYILRSGNDDTIIKQTRNYTSKISISTLADSGTHESSGLNIVGQGVGLKSNIGIGTDSPSQKLHVDGNARVTGAYYDSGNTPGTVNQVLASTATGTSWIDPGTIVAEAATLVVIACKNTSGAAIAQGTPVYQTGTVGATATIEIAPADALISANKLPAIGLLQTALNNNGLGNVVITGELTNFTTDPIDGVTPTTGDKVFVKSGGGLTLTKPTGEGNGIQNMGLVGKVSGGNAGSITVSSIMRTNDVPNLPEGRIWVGDGNTIVSDTVYIDEPNNRLGIGTSSPAEKLHVFGGAAAIEIDSTTNEASLKYDNSTTTATIKLANNDLKTELGGSEVMRILANGNVGIGTTNPLYGLHVERDAIYLAGASNLTQLLITKIGSVNKEGSYIASDNSRELDLGIWDNGSTPAGIKIYAQNNVISNSSLEFITGGTARINVNGSGNVGIGTTSPEAKLDVESEILISGTDPILRMERGDGFNSDILKVESSTDNLIIGDTSLDDIIFEADNGEAMRIDGAGNVGIGTTSPSTKLEVISAANEEGIAIKDSSGNLKYKIRQFGGNSYSTFWDSTNTEKVRITSGGSSFFNGGNVGISTTAPSHKLHLEGLSTSAIGFGGTNLKLGDYTGIGTTRIYSNGLYLSYSTANSYHDFTNAGSSLMRINPDGNVGIGTTSPSTKLHVFEAGTSMITVDSGATAPYKAGIEFLRSSINGGSIYNDGNNVQIKFDSYFGYDSANPSRGGFQFRTAPVSNNTMVDAVRIDALGSVGIGTTTPSEKLQVNNGKLYITESANASTANLVYLENSGSGGNEGVSIKFNPMFDAESMIASNREGAASDNANLTFHTALADVTTERMRITSSGNVGIGTTAPEKKLHVAGGDVLINNGQYYTAKNNTGANYKLAAITTGNQVAIGAIDYTSAGTIFAGGDNVSITTGGVAGSSRLKILSNGNVGIGTTSPSEKLHVEGDIRLLDELIFGEYSTTTDRLINQSYALTMAHSTALNFKVGTASVFNVYGTQIRPQVNNTVDLGHSGYRWKKGYFADSLIANSIGIGTDFPTGILDVLSTDAQRYARFRAPNGEERFQFYIGSTGNSSVLNMFQSDGTTQGVKISSEGTSYLNGGNVGIGITVPLHNLSIEGTSSSLLKIRNTTNGGGAAIEFNDNSSAATTQNGTLTYYHQDGVSQGGGASWHFESEPDTVLVVGSSTVSGRVVVKDGGGTTDVAYGFYDDIDTGMYRAGADSLRLVAGGVSGVSVSTTGVGLRYAGSTKIVTSNSGITVTGTATATTFSGDLNGTINTATTAVTKPNATDDTTVATTAFVQNLIETIPAGLVFQGTWNADTNTPTLANGTGTTGHFYIVSTEGSTNLDGITDWKVGDWAVFVEQGATDAWEKVDNSSVLDGSGTGNQIPKWAGSGTSNTLTDSIITDNGTNVEVDGTFTATGNSTIQGRTNLQKDLIIRGTDTLANQGAARLYVDNSNKLFIDTANDGLGLVTIDSTGNVGIGTTSPSSILDINGGSANGINIQAANVGTEYVLNAKTSNGTSRLWVGGAGNVGIGTTTPSQKLDVAGNISVYNSYAAGASIFLNHSNQYSSSIIKSIADTIDGQDSGSSMLRFYTNDNSTTSPTVALDLTSESNAIFYGKVGIGTTSPTQLLDVTGADAEIVINDSNDAPALRFRGSGVTSAMVEVNSAKDMFFKTGGIAEQMRILANGNVGIGTTSPSHRLDVPTATSSGRVAKLGFLEFTTQPATYTGSSIVVTGTNSFIQYVSTLGHKFVTRISGGGNTLEALTILPDTGNVGIGTANPSAKLDIEGDLQVKGVNISNQENLDVDTGTETIATVAIADYDAAFFDYVIKNGTDLRAGTVFAVHNGTSVEFTETSTSDLGNTSRVTLSVDISGADMRLRATATSDDWIVKSLVRAI
ncbi:hypothetical protein N9P57_00710 [Planktomarina temperata]|nr:hypothetical protein [Planktomarina temperata]